MNYAKQTLPVIPIALVILLFGLVTLWLFRPKLSTPSLSSEALPGGVRVMVNGEDRTEELRVLAPIAYSRQAPETLQLTDVSYITRKNQYPVLVFIDDSQLVVTPAILSKLPGAIRLRLEYDRP